MTLENINQAPYKYLYKTKYFKEQIKELHFVCRILIEQNNEFSEIAYLSKAKLNNTWSFKIDVFHDNVSTFNPDFTDSKEFIINYDELVKNIKNVFNTNNVIFDIYEKEEVYNSFLNFLKTNDVHRKFDINYQIYNEIFSHKIVILDENNTQDKPGELNDQIATEAEENEDINFGLFANVEKAPIVTITKDIPKNENKLENENKNQLLENLFYLQKQNVFNFNVKQKYKDNYEALKILNLLIKEKKEPNTDEKNILSKYVGFGGLKEISFDPNNDKQWNPTTEKYKNDVKNIRDIIESLEENLGVNDIYSQIKSGILNAHYTNNQIIKAIYSGIEKIGFKGGKILEPSGGIGNFIGNMPKEIRENSSTTLIEIDTISSLISKYIYNDINVLNTGYEDSKIKDNTQDLIISNVPFGNYGVYDKNLNKDEEFLSKKIHNYFFAKAIKQAKEGGLIALITSKGLLDSKSNRNVREYINSQTDFLGAVRLNNEAFKSANTKVVADIIFLRKNSSNKKNNINFLDTDNVTIKDNDDNINQISINNYFINNQENILGKIEPGGLYNNNDYTIVPSQDNHNDLNTIINKTLENYKETYINTYKNEALINSDINIELEKIKENNIFVYNELIYKKIDNEAAPVILPKYINKNTINEYIELRDVLMDLIFSEYKNSPDVHINHLRKKLNVLFDQSGFNPGTKKNIQKEWNKIASIDGEGFNVLALIDEKGIKADIFTKKTISPNIIKDKADTIEDAILISLTKHAKLKIETLKQLLNMSEEEILSKANNLIFKDPYSNFYTADEYLSGNVKKKLQEAEKAFNNGNADMLQNIEKLKLVIPKDIPIHEIEVRMGSRWVPATIYEKFGREILKDDNFQLKYLRSTDTYTTNGSSLTVEANKKWGTDRRNASKIILDALHIKPPVIKDEDINGKTFINKEETEKAVQKYDDIREAFVDWIYKEEKRREQLEKIYNEKFNNIVKRNYNGNHLSIPGINNVELRDHQKDGVWMILQNDGGVIDHLVGAGKTYVMVAGSMEIKRTGVAKKPLIIGLNSTIPQIVKSFKEAYPLANILAPSEKDFLTVNRQKFLSKIALNDYDAIIMSHEQFAKIPHDPEFEKRLILDEINEVQAEASNVENKFQAGSLETRIKNLTKRLEKLADIEKDNVVFFQQMGIDHIMVDESQQFKNLAYVTKQNQVAGLSKPTGSKRAFNLMMAIRYIQQKKEGDKGVTFLSGTPISNSIVEMYSLLKYIRPSVLIERGLDTFDQWASTFASPTTEIEFTVTGEFKSKTRFREFINLPELSILYNEIADVRNDNNLILDKPVMKGGSYTPEIIDILPEQEEYANKLIQFANTLDPKIIGKNFTDSQLQAYMLIITNLAAKMSIDMRLIDKSLPYNPDGKVGNLTKNTFEIYNETNEHKGTQLIFCDIGTPKNNTSQSALLLDYMQDQLNIDEDSLQIIFGNYNEDNFRHKTFDKIINKIKDVLELTDVEIEEIVNDSKNAAEEFNLYNEIKFRLIQKGIPEDEIQFIHSYKTKARKEKLYNDVNDGNVRILLGSTQKLGTGVNVQYRLAAIHHLDAPWRPSDMEQRNGRGLRQGNWLAKNHLNNEIPIIPYATKKTLDTYKYQVLKTKATFIEQIKTGNLNERVMKEASVEGAEAFAIMMADLSGNQNILEKFKLEAKKEKLTRAEKTFNGNLFEAENRIKNIESNIKSIKENIDRTTNDINFFNENIKWEEHKIEDAFGNENTIEKIVIININDKIIPNNEKEEKPTSKDYCNEMINIISSEIDITKSDSELDFINKKVLLKFNDITIIGKASKNLIENNGIYANQTSRELSILGPSGKDYTLNFSNKPGIFHNNLSKKFKDLNEILKNQKELLNQKEIDLIAYNNILQNPLYPKKQELEEIKKRIKEIDKELDKKQNNIQLNDEKIVINNIIYPLHNDQIDISIVKGLNQQTMDQYFLVKFNREMDYNKEWKMMIEPLFESLDAEWNKKYKSIVFKDKNDLLSFMKEISESFNLTNNLSDLDNDESLLVVNEETGVYLHNSKSEFPYLAEGKDNYIPYQDQVSIKGKYNENHYIDFFSGSDTVTSADDVAFIMQQLENKIVEHMYAMHIDKNGKHHLQFLSIGQNNATLCNESAIHKACIDFETTKLFLIHNHPSGNLKPSATDIKLTKQIQSQLNLFNIEVNHIIINTYKQAYTLIDQDLEVDHYYYDKLQEEDKKYYNKLIPFTINESEFLKKPLSDKIRTNKDLFNYMQNLRFSTLPKINLLILSNDTKIVGHYALNDLNSKDIIKKVRDSGISSSIILFSNLDYNFWEENFNIIKKDLKNYQIKILDIIFTSSKYSEDVCQYYSIHQEKFPNLLNELEEDYKTNSNFDNYIPIEKKQWWEKAKKYYDWKLNTNFIENTKSIEIDNKENLNKRKF